MENKTIIVLAIISAIGSFFEPNFTPKKNKVIKSDITIETEHYIDSIRNVNDSLLHKLKIDNKALIKDKIKLQKKLKRINGESKYRKRKNLEISKL